VIGFERWVRASGTVRLTRGTHELTFPQQNLHYLATLLQHPAPMDTFEYYCTLALIIEALL
jgi:hypothetical protein